MKKLQAMKAKKGFTLVELIVVIVIIAILAAILIPILVNHVRNSRCSSAIGDAKTAANLVAEHVADTMTQGETWADGTFNDTADGCSITGCAWGGHGVPDAIVTTVTSATPITVSTAITKGSTVHYYPASASPSGPQYCANPKCEHAAP